VNLKGFDFEEERIKQEMARLNAKRVLLQLPDGLKPEGPRLASLVEKAGGTPIISADPCYGACDLAIDEAERLSVDLIVHFGHSQMVEHGKIPTLYVEARATLAVEKAIGKAIRLIKDCRRIGLATSIQHIQTLDIVRESLVRAGKIVVIGDTGQVPYAGQVTGCNYTNVRSIASEIDAVLFVGGGKFHALGIALATSKPTFVADPYDNNAYCVTDDAQKVIKQRWVSIGQAAKAKVFGVLIGLKPGQLHLNAGLKVKEAIEKTGRQACLLALREVTPEALMEFPSIDAYVNTACPRISMEAPAKFSKPVITADELVVVFGETSWENLLKKGLFGN